MDINIEMFQKITELISSLGENSKDAFIWWLIAEYGANFLGDFIFGSVFFFFIYKASKIISHLIFSNHQIEILRKAAGVLNYFSDLELRKAAKILEEHYPKYNFRV